MISSLCFIDPTYSEDALRLRVLKGYHGLHLYSSEFWFTHLLQYANREDPVEDEDLDEPLQEIEEFWKTDPGSASLKLDDTTSVDNIESQLDVLKHISNSRGMGFDIMRFRKFLSQEKYSHLTPASMWNYVHKFNRFTSLQFKYPIELC